MAQSSSLVRPLVRALHAYVPGEQPKIKGLIKLNTNENPYPPSPKVLATLKAAVDGRLRLYPNPTAEPLRQRLAQWHGCAVENIIVGNGSDELLALATRCFVEPGRRGPASVIQYLTPSYSLYPVLSDIHGARRREVALNSGFSLPAVQKFDRAAALTFITTPNAPSGRGYSTAELDSLCRALRGVIVLDETYVDFAQENALRLALKYPHVIVARTFSKAYSLCFQRVGYFVGHPDLIDALHKIRDSYNVNGLGQIAALATLADLRYYQANFRRILATRSRLTDALAKLGFETLPSQANFILTKPPKFPAGKWLNELRHRKILVRWFDYPETRAFLRITIGTDREAAALARTASSILKTR